MLIGLILSATAVVLLAWAMLRLAIYALPVGIGAAVFLWSVGDGPELTTGLLLGLAAGVAAFLTGQMVVGSRLPILVRVGIALLFAVPAGIAGHSVVSGLMRLGGAGPTAAAIFAVLGGIIIAGVALAKLATRVAASSDPRFSALPH